MKPEYRTRALDVAHAHLVWLTATPSPLDAALDVLADVDARTTIATGSKDGTGRRAIGSYSDPTATTATARAEVAIAGQRTAKAIHADIDLVAITARRLRAIIGGTPPTGTGVARALADIGWCLTAPHTVEAWTSDDADMIDEVDHRCDVLARQSAVLRTRVETVLRQALRPAEPKPVQQAMRGCVSCARDGGYFEPIAEGRYADLCRTCGEYRAAEGRTLPLGAVRSMHSHGKLTAKAIADALRAERSKPKRQRHTA